jgi:CrcB protein
VSGLPVAVLVAVGAAVGAPLRLLVSRAVPGARGTFAVNVVGSLVLGLCFGLGERAYAVVGVGLCGAFTTFSTFAWEAVDPPRARWTTAYAVGTTAACLAAAGAGLALGG